MKKLWSKIGHVTYRLSWPFLYFYLRFTSRTRVLIFCGNEVLVVQGWLGDGRWSLPGGGLHRGEQPSEGAIREVFEETGVSLKTDQLTTLFDEPIKSTNGFRYRCIAFTATLTEKPQLTPAKGELVAVEWQPIDEVSNIPSVARLLSRI